MLSRVSLEKVVDYTFKQIGEIRQGGRPVIFRKVKRRALILLFIPLAMPVIIIVRLLHHFITIRFGILNWGSDRPLCSEFRALHLRTRCREIWQKDLRCLLYIVSCFQSSAQKNVGTKNAYFKVCRIFMQG